MDNMDEIWEVEGPDDEIGMPIVIVARYVDDQGRRCKKYICEMNMSDPEMAMKYANKIIKHRETIIGLAKRMAPFKEVI